jgi:hypothetical protein
VDLFFAANKGTDSCGFFPQGLNSVFFNKGENCIAAGRLFVEESIHDEFVARVVSSIYWGILETLLLVLCLNNCPLQ